MYKVKKALIILKQFLYFITSLNLLKNLYKIRLIKSKKNK